MCVSVEKVVPHSPAEITPPLGEERVEVHIMLTSPGEMCSKYSPAGLGLNTCGGGVNRCDVHLQDVPAQVPSLAHCGCYVFMYSFVQSRYKSALGTPE